MKAVIRLKYRLHSVLARAGIYSKPDFVGIGAEKAGTTSMFLYLLKHPDIRHPESKELRYFDLYHDRGIRWYWSRFPLPIPGVRFVTGEFSPGYLFDPSVPVRMAEAVPNAKLIVMLRDPVEATYSHYNMLRAKEQAPPFAEAIAREQALLAQYGIDWFLHVDGSDFDHRHGHLTRAMYADLLERWLACFRREQFLFLKAEDFFRHPEREVRRTLAFLGVDPSRYPADVAFEVFNRGDYASEMPADIRRQLRELYRPHNQKLAELIGFDVSGWGV